MWCSKMALLSLLPGSFRSLSLSRVVQVQAFHVTHRGRGSRIARRALASSRLGALPVGTPTTAFDDGVSPFQITTPIYYVNDKPHIGHAYTSTACDVIARFMRLAGREVFFLSGTDEHGQKVEQSAAAKNVDPQTFVDTVSVKFRDLLSLMNVSNDKFVRTTQPNHKESVQVSPMLNATYTPYVYTYIYIPLE